MSVAASGAIQESAKTRPAPRSAIRNHL